MLSVEEVDLSSAAEVERYLKLGQWADITQFAKRPSDATGFLPNVVQCEILYDTECLVMPDGFK